MRPEQALDLLEYEQAMNEVHSQVEHKRRGGRGGERETEGLGWNAGARRGAGEGLTKEEAADEKMTVAYDAIARAACDRRVAEQAARKEAIRNGDTGAGGRRAAACRRSRAATRRDAPRPTWRRLSSRGGGRDAVASGGARGGARHSGRRPHALRVRQLGRRRSARSAPPRAAKAREEDSGGPRARSRTMCAHFKVGCGVCVRAYRTALYGFMFNVLRTPVYGFKAHLFVSAPVSASAKVPPTPYLRLVPPGDRRL